MPQQNPLRWHQPKQKHAAGEESGYEAVAVDAVIERFTWWRQGVRNSKLVL